MVFQTENGGWYGSSRMRRCSRHPTDSSARLVPSRQDCPRTTCCCVTVCAAFPSFVPCHCVPCEDVAAGCTSWSRVQPVVVSYDVTRKDRRNALSLCGSADARWPGLAKTYRSSYRSAAMRAAVLEFYSLVVAGEGPGTALGLARTHAAGLLCLDRPGCRCRARTRKICKGKPLHKRENPRLRARGGLAEIRRVAVARSACL
jgi:hypothetical protein